MTDIDDTEDPQVTDIGDTQDPEGEDSRDRAAFRATLARAVADSHLADPILLRELADEQLGNGLTAAVDQAIHYAAHEIEHLRWLLWFHATVQGGDQKTRELLLNVALGLKKPQEAVSELYADGTGLAEVCTNAWIACARESKIHLMNLSGIPNGMPGSYEPQPRPETDR